MTQIDLTSGIDHENARSDAIQEIGKSLRLLLRFYPLGSGPLLAIRYYGYGRSPMEFARKPASASSRAQQPLQSQDIGATDRLQWIANDVACWPNALGERCASGLLFEF